MKNTITIVCLVMLGIAGTQNIQAQTKEETIDWLNINGIGLLRSYFSVDENSWMSITEFEGITENNFVFRYGDRLTEYVRYKIPITSILFEDVSTLEIEEVDFKTRHRIKRITFKLNGSGLERIDLNWTENDDGYRDYSEIKSEIIKPTSFSFLINNDDLENTKRVLKAIMHLAKLSGAKENKQPF